MRFFSLVARKSLVSAAVIFAVFGSEPAFANVVSDMINGAQMKQRINSFLAEQNLTGKPAISETRLFPACSSDIVVRPMFGGMKTVELFCPDPGGFKIAVRTNSVRAGSKGILASNANKTAAKLSSLMKAEKQTSKEILSETLAEMYLTTAKSVKKGQVLSHDDVVLKVAKTKNRRDFFTKVSDVVGRKMKKKLNVNQIILNRHLEIDWDIRKGQKIIIQSTVGSVVVLGSGVSKGNAQIGELMQAVNLQSGKLVEGIVVSQKKIKVLTK